MYQYALDASFNSLRAEATHQRIDISTLGHHYFIDFDVIQKSEAHPATIHSLDILIDDGLDKIGFLISIGNGIEVVRCHLDLLHNLLNFVIFAHTFHGTLVDS